MVQEKPTRGPKFLEKASIKFSWSEGRWSLMAISALGPVAAAEEKEVKVEALLNEAPAL